MTNPIRSMLPDSIQLPMPDIRQPFNEAEMAKAAEDLISKTIQEDAGPVGMNGSPTTPEDHPETPLEKSRRRESALVAGIQQFAEKHDVGPIDKGKLRIDANGDITMLQQMINPLSYVSDEEISGEVQELARQYPSGQAWGGPVSSRWIKLNHFDWERLLTAEGILPENPPWDPPWEYGTIGASLSAPANVVTNVLREVSVGPGGGKKQLGPGGGKKQLGPGGGKKQLGPGGGKTTEKPESPTGVVSAFRRPGEASIRSIVHQFLPIG